MPQAASRCLRTFHVGAPPAANSKRILLDTTHPSTAPAGDLSPGPDTGQYAGGKVRGTIKVGNQPVTVYLEMLSGISDSPSDWETESSGPIVIAANDTLELDWDPIGVDFRVSLDAGTTPPNLLVSRLAIVEGS